MPRTRVLLLVCLIAIVHAAAYIVYQQPDWDTQWTDQAGYKRLGDALATTGQFTRYPDSPVFVPEVIRTPGYPAFVAIIYKVAGGGNHLAVAGAQAVVFAGLCVLVFFLTLRVAGERAATVAAVMAALFAPFPYYGALVVTELWTTLVATAALLVGLRAAQDGRLRDFILAGVLFGATTLVRPAFVLLPFFLAIAMPILVRSQRSAGRLRGWAALALTAAITLTPWFAYNAAYLGQFTLSPAGGIGRGLWEGAWQGRWPGRLQAELITLADTTADRAELNGRVRDRARQTGLAVEPMLRYVNEWRDIRAIWDTPTDPMERARARVVADQEYLRHAVVLIRQDPAGHVKRRLTQGAFALWAAEVPIRYSDINQTPPIAIRLIWLVQVVLLVLAAWGAIVLARGGHWIEASMLVLPLVYVTGVHLPLLCEARQSLPVKPLVIALAAIAIRPITSRQTAGS